MIQSGRLRSVWSTYLLTSRCCVLDTPSKVISPASWELFFPKDGPSLIHVLLMWKHCGRQRPMKVFAPQKQKLWRQWWNYFSNWFCQNLKKSERDSGGHMNVLTHTFTHSLVHSLSHTHTHTHTHTHCARTRTMSVMSRDYLSYATLDAHAVRILHDHLLRRIKDPGCVCAWMCECVCVWCVRMSERSVSHQ